MSSSLLLDESLSDAALKVRSSDGYSWRLPAHRLLLRAAGGRFAHALDERTERDGDAPLTIVDAQPRDVLHMLRYIYEGHVPAYADVSLYLSADRYGLSVLRDDVEAQLLTRMPFAVAEACPMLEQLRAAGQLAACCPLACFCEKVIRSHALFVFDSDLVLGLEGATLEVLLESDDVNVPDEAVIFWGLWRWGRMRCCRLGAPLTEDAVVGQVDALLPLIRFCSVRRREDIPQRALERFDRCRCRRRRYSHPLDVTEQCSAIYVAPRGWQRLLAVESGSEENVLGLQLSCDRRSFLVGFDVDLLSEKSTDTYILIMRETDGAEMRRAKIVWNAATPRKLTTAQLDPEEPWQEGSCVLPTPFPLTPGTPYSVYLVGIDAGHHLPTSPAGGRERRGPGVTLTVHSPHVQAVRTVYLWSGAEVTWGSDGR